MRMKDQPVFLGRQSFKLDRAMRLAREIDAKRDERLLFTNVGRDSNIGPIELSQIGLQICEA